MNDIQENVIAVVADTLGKDKRDVTPQSKFVEDLGADSLEQVELMMALEAKFGCDIPDEEANKIATVSDAVNYIVKHKEGN